MSAGAGIRFADVGHAFGSRRVLSGLSFQVAPGEIYGLLGPNGAGKTTALRILAGLLVPLEGRAFLHGREVAAAPEEARRHLGFATGSTGLHARLTVQETLLFFGRLHGVVESDLPRRIQTVSEALDLGALLGRRCDVLSTGQKQRVTLARAAIADPPVLVLDEPTLGLDVLASQGLRLFMREERERGKAVLFSTHYLTEAELLCDRVGVLHDGQLLAEGSPQALKEQLGAASLEEAFLRLVAGLRDDPVPSEPARGQTELPAPQANRDRE